MTPTHRAVLVGEFLGTFLLILLGDGVVASVELLGKQADWIVITTGWALAVTLGVFVSGRLSGGHLNPAVTVALATRGELAWGRVPLYVAAQLAGAFAGALTVYLDYAPAFTAFDQKHAIVRGAMALDAAQVLVLTGPAAGGAGIFATYPAFHGILNNLLSEFLGTAVLLFAVRALGDRRNNPPGANLGPVFVGLVVWAIGLSLGGLTGYAINPARDLGPRLATAVAGWGSSVFRSHGYYFWIPIVGPIAGGVLGVWLYEATVGAALAERESMAGASTSAEPTSP